MSSRQPVSRKRASGNSRGGTARSKRASLDRRGSDAVGGDLRRRIHIFAASPAGKFVLLGAVAIALAFCGACINAAWRQTSLSEEYLPELRVDACRSPKDGAVLALLGARLAQARDVQALAVLTDATSAGNQDELIWQTKAWTSAEIGDGQGAVTALNDGIKALNGNAPALSAALGGVDALVGQTDIATLAQAVSPEGAEPLAAAYSKGSFLDTYVDEWGRAHPSSSGFATRLRWARDEPDNAQAQLLWGLALLENERAPEAVEVLRSAAALSAHSEAVQLALGQALESEGDSSAAGDAFLNVLTHDSASIEALTGFGSASLAEGRLSIAMAAMHRAARLAPTSADAWVGLGRASDVGPEQLAAFQKAIELAPGRTDFLDDYANALIRQGQYARAEDILRRDIAASPYDATAQTLLSQSLFLDDPDPANLAASQTAAVTALQLRPDDSDAEAILGKVLLQERKPLEAIPHLSAAMSANPSDFATRHVLVQAYREAGQPAMASREQEIGDAGEKLRDQLAAAQAGVAAHFMDLSFHYKLLAIYVQAGNAVQAARERSLIEALSANPGEIKGAMDAYELRMREVLGPDAPPLSQDAPK